MEAGGSSDERSSVDAPSGGRPAGWPRRRWASLGSELWPVDPTQAQLLPETPSCGPDSAPTISQTEGPYYTPHTPAKRDFRADAPGEAITLTGFVIDRRCQPVADAVVDLWHADARGAYDNSGFKLRGYQITDTRGRYVFETIVPGIYPGRTRHFHVKVAVPGRRVLTTQLYFPDDARQQPRRHFRPPPADAPRWCVRWQGRPL